jgi:hypothetical protein
MSPFRYSRFQVMVHADWSAEDWEAAMQLTREQLTSTRSEAMSISIIKHAFNLPLLYAIAIVEHAKDGWV